MRNAFRIAWILPLMLATARGAESPPAPRAPMRPLKIGYVDVSRVLNAHPRRQEFQKALLDLRQSLEKDIRTRMEEVNRLRGEIEQLAEESPERLEREGKLRQRLVEAERAGRENRDLLSARAASMLRTLYDEVVAEVQTVGRKEGFDLILKDQTSEKAPGLRDQAVLQISQHVVLYSRPEYDITDRIIERLEAKYAKPTDSQSDDRAE